MRISSTLEYSHDAAPRRDDPVGRDERGGALCVVGVAPPHHHVPDEGKLVVFRGISVADAATASERRRKVVEVFGNEELMSNGLQAVAESDEWKKS